MAKSPSQESGIFRIKGAPATFIWISCYCGNVKMRDSFSFSWLQWKISSYFLLLLFGVRTQILLPSLSSRRREATSNFLPGFPVKPHKLQLPSSIIYEVRGGWSEHLFRGLSIEGLGKLCRFLICVAKAAWQVALHVLLTLLPQFVCWCGFGST